MSTILIAGNVRLFTAELLEHLAQEHKLVIAGSTKGSVKGRKIHIYNTNPMEEKFSQLFDVYSIDVVWYVSGIPMIILL